MATVAFYAAGAAIGAATFGAGAVAFAGITYAAIGGAIGAAVGAYVDQNYLFPAIFGRGGAGGITGPRVDDFQLQSAAEGTPVKFCVGPRNRIAGEIIWLRNWNDDPTLEVAVTESAGGGKGGGGGGGGGSSVTNYYYYVDLAVSVCEGPVEKVRKVWADSKLIYDDGNDPYEVTGVSVDTLGNYVAGFAFADVGFAVGRYVTVSGCGNPANNGRFRITASDGSSVTLDGTHASEAPAGPVTFTLDPYSDARYRALRVLPGTDDQEPDPYMQAKEGADATPAYRGECVVVIENFAIKDWGNRLPQFNFLVEKRKRQTVGEAIEEIVARSGVDIPVDAGEVRGNILGYAVAQPMSIVEQLEPLMLAFNLNCVEDAGTLYFYNRSRETVIDVEEEWLGSAAEGSDDAPRPIEFVDSASQEVPTEVSVQYLDPSTNYQQGSQIERRVGLGSTRNVAQVNLPVCMQPAQARAVAARILWSAYPERVRARVQLPPSLPYLQEGDVLRVPYAGDFELVRADTIDIGANGLTVVEGPLVEPQTYRSLAAAGDSAMGSGPPPYSPPEVLLRLLDLPALRDEDAEAVGFYHAMSAEDPEAEWRGAKGYASVDNLSFSLSFESSFEAVQGTCNTTLPAGPVGWWDRESVLDVTLVHGVLEGASELEVLNGANRLLVGSEVVAFRDAEQLAPMQYRLTRLLRGLRGTEAAVATHGSGERAVLLSAGSIGWKPLAGALMGANRFYRAVGNGGDVDAAASQTFAATGRTRVQFAPCRARGSRSAGDLTVSWTRRSRAVTRLFGSYFPTLHSAEAWEVDVMSGPTVVRTIAGSLPSVAYTAAQQTTDFGSPQPSVTVRIYQLGPDGRGLPLEATV